MQGKSNKAICRVLDLAEPTVKNHVTAILKTLNVTNRTEAVVAANNLGWKLRATVPVTVQVAARDHVRIGWQAERVVVFDEATGRSHHRG